MKFIVLEYSVLENEALTNTEKLLYGYIVSLSQNDKGCCFASNEMLCTLIGLKERQLNYCLSHLKKFNYISTSVIKGKRYITPTINKFLEDRDKENKKIIINYEDYNWLEEEF